MLQVGTFYHPMSYAPNPNRIEALDELNMVIKDWNFCGDIFSMLDWTPSNHDKCKGWARKHSDD